ncbi:MAG: hypothetical protein RMK29_08450 [Myxococcales bacterium]|nr:hypothetical protein [Myxococcota bacterium]MDW8281725.1 hypothetical protein [Myxococcales bacterium]
MPRRRKRPQPIGPHLPHHAHGIGGGLGLLDELKIGGAPRQIAQQRRQPAQRQGAVLPAQQLARSDRDVSKQLRILGQGSGHRAHQLRRLGKGMAAFAHPLPRRQGCLRQPAEHLADPIDAAVQRAIASGHARNIGPQGAPPQRAAHQAWVPTGRPLPGQGRWPLWAGSMASLGRV